MTRSSSRSTRSTASAAAVHTGLPPKVLPWVPGVISSAAGPAARQAPMGSPPPSPLASVTMSGSDALVLMGVERAGAADTGLHLVEGEEDAVLKLLISAPRPGSHPAGRPRHLPMIGSRNTAAVWESTAFARAATSP